MPDAVEVSGTRRDRAGSSPVAHAVPVPVGLRVAVAVDEPVRFVHPVGPDSAHHAAGVDRLDRLGHWHWLRYRHQLRHGHGFRYGHQLGREPEFWLD